MTTTQRDLHTEAVCDRIREECDEKYPHLNRRLPDEFEISLPHANDLELIPTMLHLSIDYTEYIATLLRFDRGCGLASFGIERI